MPETPAVRIDFTGADSRYAVVRIDFPPLNIGSHAMRSHLFDALEKLEQNKLLAGAILVGAGGNFVAGSDIREFDAPPQAPHLPDIIALVERLPFPVVAAIEGAALGGGCELALGCDWRIAGPTAVMGLPEVTLGLIPGAGGTVRLPRLIGPELAMALVTSGRRLNAQQALECGLVDELTDCDVVEAAVRWLGSHSGKRRCTDLPLPAFDRERLEAKAQTISARARGSVSVGEAAAAVLRALDLTPQQALDLEREASLRLRVEHQSKALRYLFQAERRAGRAAKGTATRDIKSVGIIGAGRMGSDIAYAFAAAGRQVLLVEANEDVARRAIERITQNAERLVKQGEIREAIEVTNRVKLGSIEDLGESDLVVEAIPEDMQAKKALFATLDKIVAPTTILATNTSYLDINEMSVGISNPERIVGMHFFNPASILKLVEIIETDSTSAEVIATMLRLSRKLGKLPISARIGEGFVGNRIFAAYRRQCEYLIADGCEPAEIDKAMVSFGMAMGPFAVFDLAGLDVAWAMRKRLAAQRPASERYIDIPDKLCELGRLGRNAGQGWYDYVDGKPVPSAAVSAIISQSRSQAGLTPKQFSSEEIVSALLTAMASEAGLVVEEGIAAQPEDIDVALCNGFGFPRHEGGPLYWACKQDRHNLLERIAQLAASSGRPAPKDLDRILTQIAGQ